ncbi:16S rRNA (uracil(1498)-N(3))-methyltransferase [Candidatus Sumerlaeota bacterium]|nr:16S rRNA (uracil(1498)-N(3))-methyltransferase [Candidatus Sumerlaeota bacterium]
MHEHRFFAESELPVGGEIALSPDEAHHVTRVLRLGVDQRVVLFNGEGLEAEGRITKATPSEVMVEIRRQWVTPMSPPPAIHLLVPWLKQPQRLDWLIEKAAEIGVTQIGVHGAPRGGEARRSERWRRLTIAAAKQSGQARLTRVSVIGEPLGAGTVAGLRVLLSERAGAPPLRQALPPDPPELIALLVGPERGWSDGEIAEALRSGWVAASLGPSRLRSETAALAALAGVRALFPGGQVEEG